MEPLAGSVELLEDVFHHAMIFVHPHLAVVLPAAFIGHLALGVLSGDEIVVATPSRSVHGVDIAARRIRPVRGAFLRESVGRIALIRFRLLRGIIIRIARHALVFAIDKKLVDLQARRRLRLKNAVFVGRPGEAELGAATQHRTALVLAR